MNIKEFAASLDKLTREELAEEYVAYHLEDFGLENERLFLQPSTVGLEEWKQRKALEMKISALGMSEDELWEARARLVKRVAKYKH